MSNTGFGNSRELGDVEQQSTPGGPMKQPKNDRETVRAVAKMLGLWPDASGAMILQVLQAKLDDVREARRMLKLDEALPAPADTAAP